MSNYLFIQIINGERVEFLTLYPRDNTDVYRIVVECLPNKKAAIIKLLGKPTEVIREEVSHFMFWDLPKNAPKSFKLEEVLAYALDVEFQAKQYFNAQSKITFTTVEFTEITFEERNSPFEETVEPPNHQAFNQALKSGSVNEALKWAIHNRRPRKNEGDSE